LTPKQFYDQLLEEIAVDDETMDDARTRRDRLADTAVATSGKHISNPKPVRVGAVAQGTQIDPLNDIDQVIELPYLLPGWLENPLGAMQQVRGWLDPVVPGMLTLTAHAIKVKFPDEDFTADLVIGWKQQRGILIPHCPDDEPHCWIPTDPETHKEQVLARNRTFQPGRAIFSRQIRILKHLNREWEFRYELERKPLSSFHVTALALTILTEKAGHDLWTPLFLERAADLVLRQLPDPAGVGADLEARDPSFASALLRDAAAKTRAALVAPEDQVEGKLREVFGHPGRRRQIVKPASVSVGPSGTLGVGAATALRHTPPVRSHGGNA
jgi:hypothetical protein